MTSNVGDGGRDEKPDDGDQQQASSRTAPQVGQGVSSPDPVEGADDVPAGTRESPQG